MTPGNDEREPEPALKSAGDFFRAAWIFYLLLAVGGVIWLGLGQGELRLADFVGRDTWPRDLALGGAAAGLLLGVWELGRRSFASMRELEGQTAAAIGPIERGEVLVLALVSGFAEELFFRGAMLAAWGPWVSAPLFALMHSGRGRAFRSWTLFALIAAGIFSGLVLLTGNLLAAIWAHVLVNAVNLWRFTASDPPAASENPRH